MTSAVYTQNTHVSILKIPTLRTNPSGAFITQPDATRLLFPASDFQEGDSYFTPAFQKQVSTATLACHSSGDNKSVNTEYIESKNLKEEKAKNGAGRDKSSRSVK